MFILKPFGYIAYEKQQKTLGETDALRAPPEIKIDSI
jgi:hypothetical protein